MQIMVRDNNVDQALRALKKKLQREGVYREMKLRRHRTNPLVICFELHYEMKESVGQEGENPPFPLDIAGSRR